MCWSLCFASENVLLWCSPRSRGRRATFYDEEERGHLLSGPVLFPFKRSVKVNAIRDLLRTLFLVYASGPHNLLKFVTPVKFALRARAHVRWVVFIVLLQGQLCVIITGSSFSAFAWDIREGKCTPATFRQFLCKKTSRKSTEFEPKNIFLESSLLSECVHSIEAFAGLIYMIKTP